MSVVTKTFKIPTKGNNDIIDITSNVEEALRESGVKNGIAYEHDATWGEGSHCADSGRVILSFNQDQDRDHIVDRKTLS